MIELRELCREGEGGRGSIRGISLCLGERGLTALLGEGGETLLRVLGALERPDGGEVVLGGQPRRESAQERECWRGSGAGYVGSGMGLLEGESVFANVELPMLLSGVEKTVRRRRAAQLIKRLGLQEKANALPAKLSYAERYRADIARALANDPELLLLSRPLEGLEKGEAAELLALLRAVGKDRPVVFTAASGEKLEGEEGIRRINLEKGAVVSDSAEEEMEGQGAAPRLSHPILGTGAAWRCMRRGGRRRRGARLASALAVAIVTGLLGTALALPRAWEEAGREREDDALSVLPLCVTQRPLSAKLLLDAIEDASQGGEHGRDALYVSDRESAWRDGAEHCGEDNDLNALLEALYADESMGRRLSAVEYEDGTQLHIYASDTSLEVKELTAATLPGLWAELSGDRSTLERQYEVIAGRWPVSYDELVLFADENNEISDLAMRALGLYDGGSERKNYENILSTTYRLLRPTDYYQCGADGRWARIDGDRDLLRAAVERGMVLHVVGIVRPSGEAMEHAFSGVMGYTPQLRQQIAAGVEQSGAVIQQRQEPGRDIFTLLPFLPEALRDLDETGKAKLLRAEAEELGVAEQMAVYMELSGCSQADAAAMVSGGSMAAALGERLQSCPDGRCAELCERYILSAYAQGDWESNLSALGANSGNVTALRLYSDSFEDRSALAEWLRSYNRRAVREGEWTRVIEFEENTAALVKLEQSGGQLLPLLLGVSSACLLLLTLLALRAVLRTAAHEMRPMLTTLALWGVGGRDAAGILRLEGLLPGLLGGAAGVLLGLCLCAAGNALASGLWDIPLHLTLRWWEALSLGCVGPALALLSCVGTGKLVARLSRL